jgi:hypothetical protein
MKEPMPRRNVCRLEISELALTSDAELLIFTWAKHKHTNFEIISARQVKQSWFLFLSERIKGYNNKGVSTAFFL